MNKNSLILLAIVIVLAGGFLLFGKRPTTAPSTTTEMTEEPTMAQTEEAVVPSEATDEATKTFTVDAKNFSYSLKEMKVKKGDTVKLTLNVKEGLHDWVVDEFNARTKQLPEGKSETIEFTADKVGTFEFYCSVGQHRKMGMVGKLIVE